MASNQQFCLRWNNHHSTLISVFDTLLESGTLVDCTLAAEGQFLKAHKVVLSACSSYLETLLSQHYEKHPIVILKDVTFQELKSMLDYMYRGEVNISQEQLGTFLKAAESLQIKGLTDNGRGVTDSKDAGKRHDFRKSVPRPRTPPPSIYFPPSLGSDHRHHLIKHALSHVEPRSKSPTHEYVNRLREGSLSPIPLKRKKRRSSNNEDSHNNAVQPTTNNSEVRLNSTKNDAIAPATISRPVTNTTKPPSDLSITKETTPTSVLEPPTIGPVKTEVKNETADDVNNEDSVGDLTLDEEEEDLELDLEISRPGPSQAVNSNAAGYGGWNLSADGSADEMPSASQQDSQGTACKVPSRPLVASLKSTAACYTGSGQHMIACPTCHKCYSSPHTLRRHVRLECGKEPQFHCPYCPRKTKQRYNLMLHIARAHKDSDSLISARTVVKTEHSALQGVARDLSPFKE